MDLDSDNKDILPLVSYSIMDFIFTIIALLAIDGREINLSSLIFLRKSLLNSFLLLGSYWLIITILVILNIGNAIDPNAIDPFNILFIMVLGIVNFTLSIDLGVAINYILLDNIGVKKALALSLHSIRGYRVILMLTIFVSILFSTCIFILLYLLFGIDAVDTTQVKPINYTCLTQIIDSFTRLYFISFFYYFWKKRKGDFMIEKL